MLEIIDSIVQLVVSVVSQLGYAGIFVMMFLESSFFPFPSEVVIPPAAYLAAQGEMNLAMVIIMGIAGSIAGALFNYFLSIRLGRPLILKFGKYFGLTEHAYEKSEKYFRKHGEISTFVGRLIPGIRQYISLPAGLARMNIPRFVFFTGLGAGIWVVVLAVIGYLIGDNQELIKKYSQESLVYILGFIVVIILAYVWWHKRQKLKE